MAANPAPSPSPKPTITIISNGIPQEPKTMKPTPQPPTTTTTTTTTTTPKRDLPLLNPPAQVARQGVSQIFDVLLSGTPFMRQLLLQETDVIYECRACRSLFRGLPNFVDHKKEFCTIRVGVANAISAQNTSSTTGLKRWLCQDREVIPIVEPESPEGEQPQKGKSKHGTPPNKSQKPKQKQQMVIRKPETTYILVRPIQGTTKAMEQMVIRPEQIVHQSQLDNLSNFKTKRQESDGTAKIVGEIAIRQAEKAAKTAQTSPELEKNSGGVEKRDALHSMLKKVKVSSSPVNSEIPMDDDVTLDTSSLLSHSLLNGGTPASSSSSSSSASKKLLMVTLGQQKKQAAQQQGNQRKAVCKVCKKECKNWTALAWHERIHKKPSFKCTLCYATTQSMYNLRRHLMNVHHLSQSKVESMLGMSGNKLKVHVQQNSSAKSNGKDDSDDEDDDEDDDEEEEEEEEEAKEEPTCTVCQKTFASKRNVKRHMKIHQREGHVTNNNKTATGGKLSSEQIAKNRLLLIMDEKNMRCRKCRKQLSGLRRLQQHCCNHFGLNRYRCSLCQYENSDYTQMRRHVMGKHGRQFRSIQQIAEAIKKMKVGLWINLIKLDNDEDDSGGAVVTTKKSFASKKSTSTATESLSAKKVEVQKKVEVKKKEEAKKDVEKIEANKAKSKNAASEDVKSVVNKIPLVMVERVSSRSRDSSSDRTSEDGKANNRAAPIVPSISTKPQLRATPVKKEPEVVIVATRKTSNSTMSRSSSPASARKAIVDSPKRETPVRQARLNHRSISSRVAQNLNLDSGSEEGATTNGTADGKKNEQAEKMNLMMDKRQIRCTECNKTFQYLSSLQRHVRTHLAPREVTVKSPRLAATLSTVKAKKVDSYINHIQLKCTKCHKRFVNLASLKRHIGRHLGYSTYKCRFCNYISRNYTWFKKHLTLSHQSNIKNVTQFGSLIASMKVKQSR